MSATEAAENDDARLIETVFMTCLQRKPTPVEQNRWRKSLAAGASVSDFIEAVRSGPEAHKRVRSTPKYPIGHYYSPVVDPTFAGPYVAKVDGDQRSLPGIRLDDEAMVALWRSFDDFLTPRPFPIEQEEGHRYWFANRAYAFNDGTALYCMLRHFQPKRIIEVGSGYSSACTLETAERFLAEDVSLTFIDPRPKLLQELFSVEPPKRKVEIIGSIVQDIPLETFDVLEKDDVLFIDSTHVMKTASDVTYEFLEILPRLKPGVIVHIHDIFWPFEYPTRWSLDDNRSWNEIYALRAFLAFNDAFEIIFFGDYFWRFHKDELVRNAPWLNRNSGGGNIWLRRK
jgi:predicted O-methyltransferase YrrM